MLITITGMELEHIEEVARIEQNTFSEPWTEQAFSDAVRSDNYLYITALDVDRVVGYAGCTISLDEADITNIAVCADYKGKGIGEKLLKVLLGQLHERNVTKVFLEVRESNIVARSLYSKTGFAEVGIRKNFYRKPDENGVVMQLEI